MRRNRSLMRRKMLSGQSLIEFAAGIIVLLIILAGIVDVGRAVFTYITMRDGAQEGASFGSVYPTYCNQIAERARNNLMDPESYTITVHIDGTLCSVATPAQACLGHVVSVTVSQPNFSMAMPLIGTIIGTQTISLSATSSDTIIRTPCK